MFIICTDKHPMTILLSQNAATPIFLRRKTASPLYPTGKRYPMKQQEWEPLCNPTPITESSSHWTRLLPKGEGKPNIKASHRKMSSLTTAKSAFSISTLIGKGKKQKHRSSALFTTCIILRGSTWAKTTSSEKSN